MTSRIGILAGLGRLPVCLAAEARRRGVAPVIVELLPGSDEQLPALAGKFHSVFMGDWQKVITTLHEEDVHKLYLLGKVDKRLLYGDVALDERFLRLMASLPEKNDDQVIKAFVTDLEQEGFVVGDQRELLSHLLVEKGTLTSQEPTMSQWRDVTFAFRMAKGVAALDIGQTVVVKDGAVLAVEAIEGTDACIMRGSQLGGQGVVVVKVAKPCQDLRFDVPTIGAKTMSTLVQAAVGVFAFEADCTFVMDRQELISAAERQGICLVAYGDQQGVSAE